MKQGEGERGGDEGSKGCDQGGKRRQRRRCRRGAGTLGQFGILFGTLLLPVSLQEAVVPQGTRVRQTLHDCIQETLSGRQRGG